MKRVMHHVIQMMLRRHAMRGLLQVLESDRHSGSTAKKGFVYLSTTVCARIVLLTLNGYDLDG
jgi:hypothetical protein